MTFLVSIEGTDGAGKRTQTAAVMKRLRDKGFKVDWFTFPQYEKSFMSKIIIKYLNGDFGPTANYHPIMRSLMFSLERYEEKEKVRSLSENNDIVILDRYVASNLAYQIAGVSPSEQTEFIDLILGVEFGLLGLQKPDLNVFLDIEPEVAQRNVAGKPERGFLKHDYDENESDIALLRQSYEAYQFLIRNKIPTPWESIECHDIGRGNLLPQEEISSRIEGVILSHLPSGFREAIA